MYAPTSIACILSSGVDPHHGCVGKCSGYFIGCRHRKRSGCADLLSRRVLCKCYRWCGSGAPPLCGLRFRGICTYERSHCFRGYTCAPPVDVIVRQQPPTRHHTPGSHPFPARRTATHPSLLFCLPNVCVPGAPGKVPHTGARRHQGIPHSRPQLATSGERTCVR